MKRVNIFVFFVVCIALTGLTGGCGKDEGVKVLKLAHGLDQTHPVHKAMVFLSEQVQEESGGSMRVDIYPSEQLGSERECLEQLQFGGLAMTKTSSSPLESFVPEMKVLGLPYIFRDSEHFWKVLNGDVGVELLAAGSGVGLKGLCFYDAGARSFYTVDTPIRKPEDLEGLKVRVQESRIAMDMVETMGASPTPISWGELYTSLQQGVVDGAENNPPSVYTSQHYKICKYYCLDEHARPPDIVLISTVVWESLSPEHQRILQKAADDSVVYERKLWAEKVDESMEEIKKEGVEIIRPAKAPFRKAVEPMLEAFKGTKIGELAERITKVQ